MSKPAVMQGVYVDCKFMAGFKVARISIDIPIEHSNEFLRMFGAPDRANPVHVVVARLQEGASAPTVPEKAAEPAPVEKAEAPKVAFKDRPRSSQCHLMLQKMDFIRWFAGNYLKGVLVDRTNGYEPHVKNYLGIKSKSELDVPGDVADGWDKLLTDYEMKDLAR